MMELAWNINRWKPEEAHNYTRYWAAKTFGSELAQEIADIQAGYYRLQAAGKDSHVWFVNYSEDQIEPRSRTIEGCLLRACPLSCPWGCHDQ